MPVVRLRTKDSSAFTAIFRTRPGILKIKKIDKTIRPAALKNVIHAFEKPKKKPPIAGPAAAATCQAVEMTAEARTYFVFGTICPKKAKFDEVRNARATPP